MVRETFNEIKSGAGKGYGANFTKFGKNAARDKAVLKMQRNIFKFSGAKNYVQLVELNDKMVKAGRVVSFDEFKEEALKINDKYNINYLQAEFQTARQAGHHARNWQQYQDEKKLFPNLKYKTAGDKLVRDSHRALEGTIAPIDSPFWDKYYPPNGYRCRCFVVQSAETVSPDLPTNVEEVKQEFRFNVGKENQVFKENGKAEHPYFSVLVDNPEVEAEVERQMVKAFRDQVRAWSKDNIAGKPIKHKEIDQDIQLTGNDIKSITGKPHHDQIGRDEQLYNISENFSNADFMFSTPETKGRPQYKTWYYFKDKNWNYYYNVAEMQDGTFKLHAITDKVTKP